MTVLTDTLPIYNIELPYPKLGSKIFCITGHKGIFVLERGACTWRAFAVTSVGSGVISVIDGVPDERGFFPGDQLDPLSKEYQICNGRTLFYAHPPILGMWMFDADCHHGLSLRLSSRSESVVPTATITWMPERKAVSRITAG